MEEKTMARNGKSPMSLSEIGTLAFGKKLGEQDLFTYPRFDELQTLLKLVTEQRVMGMVSGKAGVGKTTAVRAWTSQLATNRYQVLYFGQDQDGSNLLRRFAIAFGLKPKFRRPELILQVSQALADNDREGGKEVVAVIDEAHLFDDHTLEDIRLLTNSDFDTSSPIAIILLGQQALRLKLKVPSFDALNQRIRYRFFLEGFSQEDTRAYIRHRLGAVSASLDVFGEESIEKIFDAAEGVPREVNNICALALVKADSMGLDAVDEKIVKQVVLQREMS
jgi:type II secretory pathway predicted ATPase ExeA